MGLIRVELLIGRAGASLLSFTGSSSAGFIVMLFCRYKIVIAEMLLGKRLWGKQLEILGEFHRARKLDLSQITF